MWRERIREFLFPGTAEADQGFRREIDRLAILGLRIIAGVQIGVSVFLLAIRLVLATQTAALSLRLRQAAVMIVLGVLNGLASKRNRIGAVARPLAVLSSLATAGVLIWASLIAISISTNPNDFIPGQITLVMLVAVTAIPLRPMQTLALGLAIGVEYLILSLIAERQFLNGLGPDENYTLFVIMLAALCTGITAILYQQRVSNYRILQQTIEAAEALREVQTRVVMTESASSLSRLAAAVSHEMNNPVGALLSGVDTLLLLASKQATSSPNEHERIVRLQSEVRRSIEKSAERLRQLVSRMQRFTNLDQAEVQKADVNELLKDVAALRSPDLQRSVQVEFNFQPIPPIVCRPQQLSVVFSSILDNAFRAVNGNGRVVVTTRPAGKEVEIDIEDNGRGVKSQELDSIFDPAFRVEGGRIAAGNWGLFNSRQIVREHGGEIRILSSEGRGTRVTITLPYDTIQQS